jgi:hypothetical protein
VNVSGLGGDHYDMKAVVDHYDIFYRSVVETCDLPDPLEAVYRLFDQEICFSERLAPWEAVDYQQVEMAP